MEFYSGKPDYLAASVRDYCTGVLKNGHFLAISRLRYSSLNTAAGLVRATFIA